MLNLEVRREVLREAARVCKSRPQCYGRLFGKSGSVCAEGAVLQALVNLKMVRHGSAGEQPFVVTEKGASLFNEKGIYEGYAFSNGAIPWVIQDAMGIERCWPRPDDLGGVRSWTLWELNDFARVTLLSFADMFEHEALHV